MTYLNVKWGVEHWPTVNENCDDVDVLMAVEILAMEAVQSLSICELYWRYHLLHTIDQYLLFGDENLNIWKKKILYWIMCMLFLFRIIQFFLT